MYLADEVTTDWLTSLCSCCHVAVSVPCPFLVVPWVGLWYVVFAFPRDTHMLFEQQKCKFVVGQNSLAQNRKGLT